MITQIKEVLQNAIDELNELEEENMLQETQAIDDDKPNMENVLDNYLSIRIDLFNNKLDELILREHLKTCMSKQAWLKEFGTINLDFGRRNGKSYFIKQYDQPEFKDIICAIFHNYRSADDHDLKHVKSFNATRPNNELKHLKSFYAKNPDNHYCDYPVVIIDCSAYLEKHVLEHILSACYCPRSKVELIVLT